LLGISIWLLGDALIATAPKRQVNCRGLLEGASDEGRDGMRKTVNYCVSLFLAIVSIVCSVFDAAQTSVGRLIKMLF
jgi:hypothetical protein